MLREMRRAFERAERLYVSSSAVLCLLYQESSGSDPIYSCSALCTRVSRVRAAGMWAILGPRPLDCSNNMQHCTVLNTSNERCTERKAVRDGGGEEGVKSIHEAGLEELLDRLRMRELVALVNHRLRDRQHVRALALAVRRLRALGDREDCKQRGSFVERENVLHNIESIQGILIIIFTRFTVYQNPFANC